jgi:integrase
VKRPPTDFELQRVIYERHMDDYEARVAAGSLGRIFVPLDNPAIAHDLDSEENMIFGRLYARCRCSRCCDACSSPGSSAHRTPVRPISSSARPRAVMCSRGNLRRAFEAAKTKATIDGGDERLSWHSLRHSFASVLATDLELPATTLAQIIGHSDPVFTLKVYARDGRNEAERAVD